jgi:hypothetical protein
MRALLPRSLPVLGSLYGAKIKSASKAKSGLTSFAVRSGASLIRLACCLLVGVE